MEVAEDIVIRQRSRLAILLVGRERERDKGNLVAKRNLCSLARKLAKKSLTGD